MKLIISQENGFKKQLQVEKAITRIGSSPANDIQLNSPYISAFHLQILYAQEMPDRCQVVNLAAEAVAVFSKNLERPLPAFSSQELFAGDEINIKGVRLLFELPLTTGTLITSHKISASLAFSEPVMRPNTILVGRITLKNEGEQPSCQFVVEISGLPEDCYQVDPIPLMYPGAQEDVNVRFLHRKSYPAAGFQSVTLSVTAPASYPGEQVSIQQGIYVLPVLEQGLDILDDMPAPQVSVPPSMPAPVIEPVAEQDVVAPISPVEALIPAAPVEVPPVSLEPRPVAVEFAEPEPEVAVPLVQEEPPPIRPLPVKPKVVRTPAESFWDE